MTEMADVTGRGESDGPPPGEEAWKDQTKAIERVIEIALTLDRPRTAEWIADEAAVAEQTARDHLSSLSELGVVAETTARGVTKYQLDLAYKRFKEVSQYVEKFDRDELIDIVAETKEDIQATQDRYGVESPDALRSRVTDDDVDAETVREYKKVASEWETLEHTLDVVQEAIDRYDEFSRHEVVA